MYEHVTEPWLPRPIDTFKGPPGPPTARWIEWKARRSRVSQRFGDLQVHPWRGERQAGFSRGLYANNARMVDRDLRAVPYPERLQNPPSGAYPLVHGAEIGTGPNPFHEGPDVRYVVGRRDQHPPNMPSTPAKVPVDKDMSSVPVGPAATAPQPVIPKSIGANRPYRGGAWEKANDLTPKPVRPIHKAGHSPPPKPRTRMARARKAIRKGFKGAAAAGGYAAGAIFGATLGPVGSAIAANAGGALGTGLANAVLGY